MIANDEQTFNPGKRKGLRTGYTTGACATAAALAATRWLLHGQADDPVTIRLPAGQDATFDIADRARGVAWTRCSVIKDAGDDQDVSHGAEIRGRGWRRGESSLLVTAGPGVGTVTRPGHG